MQKKAAYFSDHSNAVIDCLYAVADGFTFPTEFETQKL
jgi:hypothetical protein